VENAARQLRNVWAPDVLQLMLRIVLFITNSPCPFVGRFAPLLSAVCICLLLFARVGDIVLGSAFSGGLCFEEQLQQTVDPPLF